MPHVPRNKILFTYYLCYGFKLIHKYNLIHIDTLWSVKKYKIKRIEYIKTKKGSEYI